MRCQIISGELLEVQQHGQCTTDSIPLIVTPNIPPTPHSPTVTSMNRSLDPALDARVSSALFALSNDPELTGVTGSLLDKVYDVLLRRHREYSRKPAIPFRKVVAATIDRVRARAAVKSAATAMAAAPSSSGTALGGGADGASLQSGVGGGSSMQSFYAAADAIPSDLADIAVIDRTPGTADSHPLLSVDLQPDVDTIVRPMASLNSMLYKQERAPSERSTLGAPEPPTAAAAAAAASASSAAIGMKRRRKVVAAANPAGAKRPAVDAAAASTSAAASFPQLGQLLALQQQLQDPSSALPASVLPPSVRPEERYATHLGGISSLLGDIMEVVEYPLSHPEIFSHLGVPPPTGILLHGPPGCGKTLIARAIAGELGCYFRQINAPEIVGGVSGESEARLRAVFDDALENAPAIVFIDEVDAIAPKRDGAGGGGRGMERRIVAQLVACLDGLSLASSRVRATPAASVSSSSSGSSSVAADPASAMSVSAGAGIASAGDVAHSYASAHTVVSNLCVAAGAATATAGGNDAAVAVGPGATASPDSTCLSAPTDAFVSGGGGGGLHAMNESAAGDVSGSGSADGTAAIGGALLASHSVVPVTSSPPDSAAHTPSTSTAAPRGGVQSTSIPAAAPRGVVLVIGATSRPEAIDPALRRAGRFDREISVPIPDENAREEILRVLASRMRLGVTTSAASSTQQQQQQQSSAMPSSRLPPQLPTSSDVQMSAASATAAAAAAAVVSSEMLLDDREGLVTSQSARSDSSSITSKAALQRQQHASFDFRAIARATPGFVGADLAALSKEAAVCAVNRAFGSLFFAPQADGGACSSSSSYGASTGSSISGSRSAGATAGNISSANNGYFPPLTVLASAAATAISHRSALRDAPFLRPRQLEGLSVTFEDFMAAGT